MDENLKKLTEDFITERVAFHGANAPSESDATKLDTAYKALYASLDATQKGYAIDVENAQSLMAGESERYFYRAGFTDAVKFITQFTEN